MYMIGEDCVVEDFEIRRCNSCYEILVCFEGLCQVCAEDEEE